MQISRLSLLSMLVAAVSVAASDVNQISGRDAIVAKAAGEIQARDFKHLESRSPKSKKIKGTGSGDDEEDPNGDDDDDDNAGSSTRMNMALAAGAGAIAIAAMMM